MLLLIKANGIVKENYYNTLFDLFNSLSVRLLKKIFALQLYNYHLSLIIYEL